MRRERDVELMTAPDEQENTAPEVGTARLFAGVQHGAVGSVRAVLGLAPLDGEVRALPVHDMPVGPASSANEAPVVEMWSNGPERVETGGFDEAPPPMPAVRPLPVPEPEEPTPRSSWVAPILVAACAAGLAVGGVAVLKYLRGKPELQPKPRVRARVVPLPEPAPSRVPPAQAERPAHAANVVREPTATERARALKALEAGDARVALRALQEIQRGLGSNAGITDALLVLNVGAEQATRIRDAAERSAAEGDAQAHYVLAAIRMVSGQTALAVQSLRKAVEVAPKNDPVAREAQRALDAMDTPAQGR